MISVCNRREILRWAVGAAGLSSAVALDSLLPTPARGEDVKMPHLKYAICNETFGDWPMEKAFALAAECGYQGIEIAPFTMGQLATDVSAKRRAEVRRMVERAGLEVIGLHWLLAQTKGFHLTSGDADVRRKTADYFGELARFCADLGGKMMILGSPQQRSLAPDVSKEQGMKRAAEILLATVPVLEKTNVVIGLEPLAAVETNFLTTAAEAVELMKRVDSPQIRLHLDCKAMAAESIPIPELIRKYQGVFVHFHANDPNRQGPGFGELDFAPILAALREVSYRGWVSVEVLDYSAGPERIARQSIEYLRQCERAGNG
jgi:sugar phosphate isomerase/epimerase